MRIMDLLQRRAALIGTALNVAPKAFNKEGEVISERDHKDLLGLIAKINIVSQQINERAGTPVKLDLIDTLEDLNRAAEDLEKPFDPVRIPSMNSGMPPKTDGRLRALMPEEKKTFRNLFYGGQDVPLDRGGFESFNEYLNILHSGMTDPRFIRANMVEGVGESGGFIVPTEYGAFLLDHSLENEIVRPRATVWPMASATRRVPAWSGFDHTNAVYGGIVGQWLDETEEAGAEVEPKLREILLEVKRLACYSRVSDALLADSQIDTLLGQALINGLGWYLDLAFLYGDGVGKPTGVFNDKALISLNRTVAGKIQYVDLCQMFARMAPACLGRAVWVASQTTIPDLLTLTVPTGETTGEHVPALREDGKGGFTLLTKPVIFTEKVPALGSKHDISLIDFSQYAIGMRKELSIDRSQSVYWKSSETAYRCIARVDGLGTWSEPIQPKYGETLSWCVTLDLPKG